MAGLLLTGVYGHGSVAVPANAPVAVLEHDPRRIQITGDPGGAWTIAVARPDPRLAPGVLGYKGFDLASGPVRRRLEVPNGHSTLLLGFGRDIGVYEACDGGSLLWSGNSLLTAPQLRPVVGVHGGGLRGVEVIMAPWAAFALFGLGMADLRGSFCAPADLLGPRADDVTERLAAAPDWPARFAEVDRLLLTLLKNSRRPAERVVAAWRQLVGSGGAADAPSLAERCGCSQRQLERGFQEQIGLTPKAVSRVLRLQSALRHLEAGRAPTAVAVRCGYYDQPHFTREFAAMTGRTPRRFADLRALMSGRDPDLDRIAGAVTSLVFADGSG